MESADWLLYSTYEIAKLLGRKDVLPLAMNLRRRIVEGVKEELLELVNLKGIGRVRARMLFNAGFKTVGDPKEFKAFPASLNTDYRTRDCQEHLRASWGDA